MKLQNQSILITGGSSGIGLELARQLLLKGNDVLICGRSLEKLEQARKALPKVLTYQCDVSGKQGRDDLLAFVERRFPSLTVLVNNAAIVHKTNFDDDANMIAKAQEEIDTNLVAPIALSKLFLPILKGRESAIINISTGLVFAPRVVYPIYNSTKAGLRAFTQVLRQQLSSTRISVIEVLMPAVDTPWHKGEVPKIAITPEKAVAEMVLKVERNKREIKIGAVKQLYWLSRLAPGLAFKMINRVT